MEDRDNWYRSTSALSLYEACRSIACVRVTTCLAMPATFHVWLEKGLQDQTRSDVHRIGPSVLPQTVHC